MADMKHTRTNYTEIALFGSKSQTERDISFEEKQKIWDILEHNWSDLLLFHGEGPGFTCTGNSLP